MFNKTFILLIAGLMLSACSDNVEFKAGDDFSQVPNNGTNTTDFDKQALITDLTDHVFVPATQAFVDLADQQLTALQNYCTDLTQNEIENELLKVSTQEAWRAAMTQWQQLEVMQIGPLFENESELRNKIYSWPNPVNSCAVDQDVGHHENGTVAGSPYDIKNRTNSRRGLDALEYLLFTPSLEHSCPRDNLAPADWNARPTTERLIARCEFATTAANDILASANTLHSLWVEGTDSQPSYSSLLKSVASSDNSEFENIDDALNHITDALFYVSKITKDAKVGAPIGLIANSCGTAQCLTDIESLYSEHSLANIRANMQAMLLVFEGAAPETHIGFDDYLVASNASELAATMKADITNVITFIDSFDTSLAAVAQNDPAQVQALYENIKKVTDNLKSTFITILALQLPDSSAGDAD